MSFLAPLFLLGTLIVAAPVIFHLIRRTTREQRIFSSLMFLEPTPPRVTRRSRLDNLFLLLLRCLVVCLLAFGFARPFLKKPEAAVPERGEVTKVILLVDNSASMRREDLWNQALRRAEQVLRDSGASDEVAVLAFDQQIRTLVSFAQWRASAAGGRVPLALGKLQEIKPSWAATALGHALTTASETFEQTEKKEHAPGKRRIVLISDLQEGSRLEGLQGYEWPRGCEVMVESVKAKNPSNGSIQLLSSADETGGDALDAKMRIRVTNSRDAQREQFQIRLMGAATNADVYVPPGQNRTLLFLETGSASGDRLVLSGDDADFDNVVHVVAPKTNEVRILFLGPEAERDPGQALYYLKRAFQSTRRQSVTIAARSRTAMIAPGEFSGAQLVVVAGDLPDNQMAFVKETLSKGGTVLVPMKTVSSAALLGRLTDTTGAGVEEATGSGYAMLAQIDFEDPLFAPFADPRFSDFTKIHFWHHRRLKAEQWPKARVLARFDGPGSDPAIMQIPVGDGNVFVLTFGWVPSDSQFALSSKFVPFLYSLLERSGAIKIQTSQYTIGDPIDLAAMQANGPWVVRKPDGTEATVPAGRRFTHTDIPGIYSVQSAQPPQRFAVNLAADESRTAPLPVETLERLGVPVKIQMMQTEKQVQRAQAARQHLIASELENRQKLWRWLIVAALVILMMETWLAGRLTRRAAPPTEAAI